MAGAFFLICLKLFQSNLSAGFFKFFLHGFGLGFGNGFFHYFWRSIRHIFGFLEPDLGELADYFDDSDLIGAR